jgi:hypothetical protein
MADDTKDPKDPTPPASDPPAPPPPAPQATISLSASDLREALRDKAPEKPTGKNATTTPDKPAEHYFLAADGKTQINAFGEEKGSDADKRRMVAVGLASV